MLENNYKITVFTATYNRSYTLFRLYESLINQSSKNFEWLIVDDGSADDTKELIESFILDQKIDIKYYRQQNGGKHRAINKGVQLARGELFYIVDSDDFLVTDSLEMILDIYNGIKDDNDFAGVCGLKVYPNMTPLGGEPDFEVIDANAIDIRYKYHIKEDLAEVFKTEILKDFAFPDIEGEKFCPESLLWNRIAEKYKLRYTNKKIYICEYLEDGLSKASVKIRIKSPNYATTFYQELFYLNIPIKYRIKAGINYWRFALYTNQSLFKLLENIGWISLPLLPIGQIFKMIDGKIVNKY